MARAERAVGIVYPRAGGVQTTLGAPQRRGGRLLLTGLSGSGKSTIAKAVRDRLVETTDMSVTLLDGDEVRRHPSAGLSFSVADRETNIRRIGWLAAEIAHHGGLVLCSPIAPFARTRAEVRAFVEGEAHDSCSCTWPHRWRSASAVTASACMPRHAPG